MAQHDTESILKELQALEDELKALKLWGGPLQRPSEEKINSQSPFGLNVIEFHEWLEYVLIAKLRMLILEKQPLPSTMMVHTFAQEQYRGKWSTYRKLIGILQRLDKLISLD